VDDLTNVSVDVPPWYDVRDIKGKRYILICVDIKKEKYALVETPYTSERVIVPTPCVISVISPPFVTEKEAEEFMYKEIERRKNKLAKTFINLLAKKWKVEVSILLRLKEELGNECPLLMITKKSRIITFSHMEKCYSLGICLIGFASLLPASAIRSSLVK